MIRGSGNVRLVAALLALRLERESAPEIVPSDAGKLLAETTAK